VIQGDATKGNTKARPVVEVPENDQEPTNVTAEGNTEAPPTRVTPAAVRQEIREGNTDTRPVVNGKAAAVRPGGSSASPPGMRTRNNNQQGNGGRGQGNGGRGRK